MKAVILAGGLGRRLRPLTRKIPKPLLPIGNSTAIEIAIRGLARHGVREIYVATRYQAEQFESHLGDGSRYGVELHYSVETEPLGTCGPLALLEDRLTSPFIMMNGDVITELDFERLLGFAREVHAELTVVTKEDVTSLRYGVVRSDGDFVTGIEEKPSLSNEVLAGIYVISPAVFDLIPNRRYGIDELIDDLLEQDRGVARYVTGAYWRDVGEIDSYQDANREYADRFPLVPLRGNPGSGESGDPLPAEADGEADEHMEDGEPGAPDLVGGGRRGRRPYGGDAGPGDLPPPGSARLSPGGDAEPGDLPPPGSARLSPGGDAGDLPPPGSARLSPGLKPRAGRGRPFGTAPRIRTRPGIWASAERFLLSPWVVMLSLFVLASFNYVLAEAMSYGETQTLMYAKQFADSDYLPGDWYLNRYQPVRIPYQVLIYPLVKLFPLHVVSVLARLLGYLCVTVALGLIAHRLRVNAAYACIALGSYLWLNQSLIPAQEDILKMAESKVLAYALVLFAMHALIGNRLRLAGALAGLAMTMHIVVGGWSTAALGLTVLSRQIGGWRDRAAALGLLCVTGSWAIYCVFFKLMEPKPPAGFDVAYMWTYFRNPHHMEAVWWNLADFKTIVFVVLVGLLGGARAIFRGRGAYAVTSSFTLWTLVPFVAGVAASQLSFAARLLQYLPFRVADTLIPLLGLLIAVPIFFRDVLPRQARPLIALLLVGFFFSNATKDLMVDNYRRVRFPRGGHWVGWDETRTLYDVCGWIKENTPSGALLIVTPKINVVPYHCRRPVVVTFRDVPSGAADFAEWYRRLVDFNGGEELEQSGYDAESEIDENFNQLAEADYRALGEKYGGSYLLLYQRAGLSLPHVYGNQLWTVYALADETDRGGRPRALLVRP